MTRIRARRPTGATGHVVVTSPAEGDILHSRLEAATLFMELAEALFGSVMIEELTPKPLDGENARPDVLTADV